MPGHRDARNPNHSLSLLEIREYKMTCEPTSRKPSNQVPSNPCSCAQKSRCKEHPPRPPPSFRNPKEAAPRKASFYPCFGFPACFRHQLQPPASLKVTPARGAQRAFENSSPDGLAVWESGEQQRPSAKENRGKPGKTLTSSDSDSFRGGRKVGIARGWTTSEWPTSEWLFVGWESIATGFRYPHVTITGNGTTAVDANALRIKSQSQSQVISF